MDQEEVFEALLQEHESVGEIAKLLELLEEDGCCDPDERRFLEAYKKTEFILHGRKKVA